MLAFAFKLLWRSLSSKKQYNNNNKSTYVWSDPSVWSKWMNHFLFFVSSWSFIYKRRKKWSYPQSNSFKLIKKRVNFPLNENIWNIYDHANAKHKTKYLREIFKNFKLNCVVCVSTYVTIKAEAEQEQQKWRRKKTLVQCIS